MNPENSPERLKRFFDAREEWLAIDAAGASFALRRGEIEIGETGGRILLEFPAEKGFAVWRAAAWKIENGKITFELAGRFGREKRKITFAPRVAAAELGAAISLARIEKAGKIAALIAGAEPGRRLVRASLNKDNGRLAQIVFANRTGKQTAALADVSDALSPESLLATAVLRLERLRRRKKHPIEEIFIAAEEKTAKKLLRLAALLRAERRREVKILALKNGEIRRFAAPDEARLDKEKPGKFPAPASAPPSDLVQKILALAPDETDVVFTRGGETVRFRGLPFLRVRRVFGAERAWLGVDGERRILSEANFGELGEMIEALKIYRRFDSPNRRHDFYSAAPEAWLESILRRDIRRLDSNLILSPVFDQFRVAGEKIDLLAARRDGRLVVIEVKTAADRATVFQAADYWRKIEAHRRAGDFERHKIFGAQKIADSPPLVYLVAPALSFHPDTEFFARRLDEKIEMFRFDLNENWRETVKVLSRRSLTEKL